MTDIKIVSNSESDTSNFAKKIAEKASIGDIFCLHGDLGAGKTVFSRSFIKSLVGKNTEVPSPTFTLVQTYNSNGFYIWHFDLYRLKNPEEIYELGWEEALQDNIVIIEWSENAENIIPNEAHHIYFTIDDNKRHIHIKRGD